MAVAEVAAETFLRVQGIVHRFDRLEFQQELRADGFQPYEEVLDQRLFLAEACFPPFFRRKVFQLFFGGSDGGDFLDGFPYLPLAVLRVAQDVFSALPQIRGELLYELPQHMRPARGMLHGETVVAEELAVHENDVEAFEGFFGVLAAPPGARDPTGSWRRATSRRPVSSASFFCTLFVNLHGHFVGVEHGGDKEARLHLPVSGRK